MYCIWESSQLPAPAVSTPEKSRRYRRQKRTMGGPRNESRHLTGKLSCLCCKSNPEYVTLQPVHISFYVLRPSDSFRLLSFSLNCLPSSSNLHLPLILVHIFQSSHSWSSLLLHPSSLLSNSSTALPWSIFCPVRGVVNVLSHAFRVPLIKACSH